MEVLSVLDIGAGSTEFARKFRRLNPQTHILCGEPEWKGAWSGEVCANRIQKIEASYDAFNCPDDSLDMVVVNAYHPLMPPTGIEPELNRTLRRGGLYVSAHPVGYFRAPDASRFAELVESDSNSSVHTFTSLAGYWLWDIPCATFRHADNRLIRYPASYTIRSRLRELSLPHQYRTRSSSYMYAISDTGPSVRVWYKHS